jgi:PKD repeat protein
MLPGLTGAAAQRYTFTLTASGPNGTSKKTAAETVWPAMAWAAPKAVDPPGGSLGPQGAGITGISCRDPSRCQAVDWEGGVVTGTA